MLVIHSVPRHALPIIVLKSCSPIYEQVIEMRNDGDVIVDGVTVTVPMFVPGVAFLTRSGSFVVSCLVLLPLHGITQLVAVKKIFSGVVFLV